MKEIPTPTLDLSLISLPRGSLHQTGTTVEPSNSSAAPQGGITVQWARHLDEVRAAQKLRHDVFVHEMGAKLPVIVEGHDIDLFDDYCEHLLVKHQHSGEVIGTYRLLTPTQARRLGSTYTDTEFDLTRLRSIRERMVELGRSCVHPEHRQGSVILALWGALAEFMHQNSLDIMIGCASVPMMVHGVASPQTAANIWHQLRQTHLAGIEWQVRPRLALPVDMPLDEVMAEPPALIKGYLRLGAKVLGAPAWDPDFNTADLPMMMRLQDLPNRYRRHFLKGG
ncbi:MAG: GNAT family N-acetyltransferase [Betaproteobacteria bacterium]|jgi:putative hemolysin|nr:GNAT family N-acetyltransferase [Betaproteobacteria bacterium]NBO90101.1 GNAT family N-acetyltransferase [Betaproteobacteria bacterium]NBU44724.1 GNAT family N-acetyltransferase [Betaproteobacteria bacterium]NDF65652.1 GNAT family N-acetyltransferase [Betaproteobacteria bacterium]